MLLQLFSSTAKFSSLLLPVSQLFWDVFLPSNSKLANIFHEMVTFLTFNIWYVFYVLLWTENGLMRFERHCILLFTYYTVSWLFGNCFGSKKWTELLELKAPLLQVIKTCSQAVWVSCWRMSLHCDCRRNAEIPSYDTDCIFQSWPVSQCIKKRRVNV